MRSDGRFEREQLPDPARYFEGAGLHLYGRGVWQSAICPFHDDTRPSLRVNVATGAYRCMACSARGGDLLDFHRARHGLGFKAAARELGVWGAA